MNNLLTNEEETLLESILNNSTTETTQDNNADNNEESSTENNITSRLIPKNPDPELAKETTSRFSGASWYEEIKKMYITIIGVGGIGRFGNLEKFLVSLHPNINLIIWVCITMN